VDRPARGSGHPPPPEDAGRDSPSSRRTSRSELEAAFSTLKSSVAEHPCRALFVTGSAITGEWAALEMPDGWHFLSDLDIGVVRDRREPEIEAAIRRSLAERFAELAGERGWAQPPVLNLAFFLPFELTTQSPKPGTLEMINRAMVLAGDRSIRERFPALTVEDLTWEESIRLLGNRVLELLENPPGPVPLPIDYYRLGKFFCDLSTALLIPEGGYVSSSRERAARLPALLSDRPLPPRLHRHRDRLIESVEFWTRFRTQPDLDLIKEWYGPDPLGPEGMGLLSGLWCEARPLLEACLEALLPYRLLNERGRPSPQQLSRTSGWGTWRRRVREWRWLARFSGAPAAEVWRRGARVAFRLSPVEITYLTGFILFLRSVDGPPPCYVDEELVHYLERLYPLPNGGWSTGEDVRRELVRLWRFWLPRI
jgi:hypothetical protein